MFEAKNLDFSEKLKFNSENVFFRSVTSEITFKKFKRIVKKISTDLSKNNLKPNDLVLLDISNPVYLVAYTMACFQNKVTPALLNSFFKQEQIDLLLKENSYSLFISDKAHVSNSLKIDSNAPFVYEEGELDIPLDSKIIFYTSGSVQSKACVLTLENFFYNAEGSRQNIPFKETDVWALCLPLFHVGGFSIVVRSILSLGQIAILDSNKNYHEQMSYFKVSHTSFVSTQITRYLEEVGKNSLQYILLGGSSIPEVVLKKAIELKLPIYKSYGMTEMASQICTTQKLSESNDISFSGQLLPYREIKIENKKIHVKGPCLFKGYLEHNKINKPFDQDGWFYTNDLGEFHNDQIKVLGRSDRIFQSAGENISPELIEHELLKIPGVLKAYVCPEEDREYGLRAIAYIDKKDHLDYESIASHLNQKLSGLYRPKFIRRWSESPKTSWKQ